MSSNTYRGGVYATVYLVPKLLAWITVLVAALVDEWWHRHSHPLGASLHRALTAVVGAFTLAAAVALAWRVTPGSPTSGHGFLILVEDFSDALFMGVLLLVACGYCITRSVITRPASRAIIVAFPLTNLFTSLTVDYILLSVSDGGGPASPDGRLHITTAWKRVLFIAADFVRLLALFYGWWWIFVCVGEERKMLRDRICVALQRSHATSSVAADNEGLPNSAEHDLAAPATQLPEPAFATPHAATPSVAMIDLVVESQAPDRCKLRLLTRFTWLVQLYLVFVVGLLLFRAWSRSSSAGLLIALDVLNWLACSGLLVTFRLRAHNPYYVLSDFDGGGGAGESLLDDPDESVDKDDVIFGDTDSSPTTNTSTGQNKTDVQPMFNDPTATADITGLSDPVFLPNRPASAHFTTRDAFSVD